MWMALKRIEVKTNGSFTLIETDIDTEKVTVDDNSTVLGVG